MNARILAVKKVANLIERVEANENEGNIVNVDFGQLKKRLEELSTPI
jgi:hypothetical protein